MQATQDDNKKVLRFFARGRAGRMQTIETAHAFAWLPNRGPILDTRAATQQGSFLHPSAPTTPVVLLGGPAGIRVPTIAARERASAIPASGDFTKKASDMLYPVSLYGIKQRTDKEGKKPRLAALLWRTDVAACSGYVGVFVCQDILLDEQDSPVWVVGRGPQDSQGLAETIICWIANGKGEPPFALKVENSLVRPRA